MKAMKTAWNHVRRSPYQALAAIFIMMQTFFVLSIFTFIIFGSANVISYFESKPQVTAFFKNEAQQQNIDALADNLKQSGKVKDVTFVSKKEALAIYREQNKNDPLLLDLVTEGVLPASLEISAVNIDDLSGISDTLQQSTIVERVVYPKDVVATLSRLTNALRKIGLAIIAVLAIDSIFIMIIIIGIKISQKREEIEIMRLLSATNWYIRWPFLYEGVFYGVVGAVFGWLFASGLVIYAIPSLKAFFGVIPFLPISPLFFLLLLGAEVFLAVLLGIFSSFLAVLRYLK